MMLSPGLFHHRSSASHCFAPLDELVTWTASVTACADAGGRLAAPTETGDLGRVAQLLSVYGYPRGTVK